MPSQYFSLTFLVSSSSFSLSELLNDVSLKRLSVAFLLEPLRRVAADLFLERKRKVKRIRVGFLEERLTLKLMQLREEPYPEAVFSFALFLALFLRSFALKI